MLTNRDAKSTVPKRRLSPSSGCSRITWQQCLESCFYVNVAYCSIISFIFMVAETTLIAFGVVLRFPDRVERFFWKLRPFTNTNSHKSTTTSLINSGCWQKLGLFLLVSFASNLELSRRFWVISKFSDKLRLCLGMMRINCKILLSTHRQLFL